MIEVVVLVLLIGIVFSCYSLALLLIQFCEWLDHLKVRDNKKWAKVRLKEALVIIEHKKWKPKYYGQSLYVNGSYYLKDNFFSWDLDKSEIILNGTYIILSFTDYIRYRLFFWRFYTKVKNEDRNTRRVEDWRGI